MVLAEAAASEPMVKRLTELVEPVVRSEGLILIELLWRREHHGRVLRLVVDRGDGGVTLDDCALVSRQVSHLLDVEDFIDEAYRLEVSSPGLTRQLKSPREFDLFAGRAARLVVRREDGGTETLKGVLKGLQGDDVLLEHKSGIKAIPLAQVAKARLDLAEGG